MGYLVSRDDGWRVPDWLWERIVGLLPAAGGTPTGETAPRATTPRSAPTTSPAHANHHHGSPGTPSRTPRPVALRPRDAAGQGFNAGLHNPSTGIGPKPIRALRNLTRYRKN